MLVDDDRDLLRGASVRLRAEGYEVLTARDGAEGLAVATDKKPDAIVTDIRMPRMDGIAMMKQLRGFPSTSSIPVVVVSANVAESARRDARELEARFFLQKPFEPADLSAAIRRVTSGASVGTETIVNDSIENGATADPG